MSQVEGVELDVVKEEAMWAQEVVNGLQNSDKLPALEGEYFAK
jgi:hypothetical protein